MKKLPYAPGAHPVGMMQKMAAGSKFNGKEPTGPAYAESGMNKFEASTDGGLFYFNNYKPVTVPHYNIDFGTSVDYELSVVSLKPSDLSVIDRVLITKGTGRLLDGAEHYGFTLGSFQGFELKVVSTAATTQPMIAMFWVLDATAFFS